MCRYRDVFGDVLEKRARQKDPECLLFRLLRERGREYWFLQSNTVLLTSENWGQRQRLGSAMQSWKVM